MQWTEGIPGEQWDQTLFAAGGHFLQSSHWAAFNSALGKRIFYAYGPSWQCLAILEPARTGTRLYCPYGPLAASPKGLASALQALRELGKLQGALFVRIEPITKTSNLPLNQLGLKPALKDIQPRQTWVLDVAQSPEVLLAGMTATNRNLYNNYHAKGLTLKVSVNPSDVQFLIDMMAKVAARNNIRQHSDHYYRTMTTVLLPRGAAKIYLACHQDKPIASALCFDSPVTRYYAHAAALYEARKLHPGTALLAKMILDAQQQGQTAFDFVGVAPADAPQNHPWAGLTKFKQSFGGSYKQYPGTWELPVKPLLYGVYRSAYRLKKALR